MEALLDKEAGKNYECALCLDVAREPVMCASCEKIFCEKGIAVYQKNHTSCPFNCQNATYRKVPRPLKCAIAELKVKCKICRNIFTLEKIESHTLACQAPKCACPDCSVLQERMTSPIKIGDAKVCSISCKYAYLMLRAAETCTPGGDGKFNPVSFASEAKKIMEELLKEPSIQAAGKGPVPHFPEPMRIEPHPPVPLPIINPPPTSDIFANPLSVQCMTDFKWDTDACGANIAFVDNEKHCFLSEGGYCFRSALGNVGFTGGVHYWEIHGDPKSENELKLGVTSKKNFNLNTAFCDYDHGWAYYGLGQLRHGNNSTGQKYGKPFKNTGYIGVFLDMNRGLLSFALNGENLGPAFKDELLKKGPLYPAVALLHKAGCKLVTGKPVPSYFS